MWVCRIKERAFNNEKILPKMKIYVHIICVTLGIVNQSSAT